MKHAFSLALLLASAETVQAQEPTGQSRPNVVILIADDLGYHDQGFQGCTDVPTPHLNALAESGVRFTNGYVSGPYCSPTRAGLMTGRYQQRFGHEWNPGASNGLPLTETTIANRMKSAGYATGLVGKWHLGASPEQQPQKRGFDEFFGFLGGAHPYTPGLGAPIYRGTEVVQESQYLTDAIGRESAAFIDRHKAEPFFLAVTFNAVHTPMQGTDDRLAKFSGITDPQRRTYAAMLSALDDAVGTILGQLKTSGVDDNTLVVYFSDNGGPTMKYTSINGADNSPLRGSKRTTLEGGVRVPFLLRWPAKLGSKAGTTDDRPIIQLDILPTALAAAGQSIDPAWHLDGVNLLPYLTGENTGRPHDTLYWRMGPQRAIRQGDWKLVQYDVTADPDTVSPTRQPYPDVTKPRLYNLATDIGETHDVASENPQLVAQLEAAYAAWNAQLVAPLWGPEGTDAGSDAAPKARPKASTKKARARAAADQ
jgi:arylsulfatase A-like enzyme